MTRRAKAARRLANLLALRRRAAEARLEGELAALREALAREEDMVARLDLCIGAAPTAAGVVTRRLADASRSRARLALECEGARAELARARVAAGRADEKARRLEAAALRRGEEIMAQERLGAGAASPAPARPA